MRVKCIRNISATTGEDLGDSDPWFKRGKEYVVLAIRIYRFGFEICLISEDYNEPTFTGIEGFEFINQKFPSSWITNIREVFGKPEIDILPNSWNYEKFYGELEDNEAQAIALFNKEAEQIYREEGLSFEKLLYLG